MPNCTEKQRKLAANLLSPEYGSKRAAAIAAGYTPRTASSAVARVQRLPHFQAYLDYLKSGKSDPFTPLSGDLPDKSTEEELKQVKLELERLKLDRLRAETDDGDGEELAAAWASQVRLAYSHGVATCDRIGQHEAMLLADSAPAEIERLVLTSPDP